jgi:PAS domain S-box-containing protein
MPSQTTRFENLLETVPDALVGIDESGVIRFVNHQTESMFGYARDDLIGAPLETLVPESLQQVHAAHREGHDADPRTRSMGTELGLNGRRRDGTEFPVDIALSPVDPGSDMVMIAAVRDMTNYRMAEEDRRRLDQLSAVVEFSGEAMMSSTLDGVITSWNPASERLYGYTSEEIIDKSIGLLNPNDRPGELEAILAKTKAGEHVENLQTMNVRKDGTVFAASLTVSPIRNENGAVVGTSVISRDVTEQKQTFEAVQRMVTIVENSEEAISSSTLDGIITSWNPAAEWLYGCPSEDIIGKSDRLLIPDDRADEMEAILTKIRTGQPVRLLETMRVRRDGTVFPVSLTVSPIRDADGAVVGTVSIARDVTEQREALAAAQRIAAIVEHSDDAISSCTLDGIITSWNPAAERMFGYSSDEITDKSIGLLSPSDRPDELEAILAKITTGEHVENFQTMNVRKDGTVFPVSVTVSPIRDENGTVIGASKIAHDLTRQMEASELARSMIEASLDTLVTISTDGKITDVNEAMVKATGVPREKIIGTSFSDYCTDPEKAEEIYQRTFSEGKAVDYPLTMRHRNGTLTEVLFNASVYRSSSGKALGVFGAARDVTKQMQAAQYARGLIEAAVDPLVMISPEGKITDVNEAMVRATGIPREEIIGTSFSDHFTDPEKAEEIYQQVFTEGMAVDCPLTLRHRNAHETLDEVLCNASVYRDTRGQVIGVFAAARDVTKQVQAQREIAHQQAQALDRLAELERFQRLTVGRELKMIELKKEIEYLRKSRPADGGEPDDQH